MEWDTVTGAAEYTLYRSIEENGSYNSVNTTTTTSMTDMGRAPGTTYYYKVSASNATGESSLSDVVSATTLHQYTVVFDTQGGSSIDNQYITEGSAATEPSNPTWTGHTFDGWYSDSGYVTEWDFNDIVTGSMTLYAKWTELTTYTVSYNGSEATSGSVPDPTIFLSGDVVTVSANTNGLMKLQDGISLLLTEWNTKSDGNGDGYEPGAGSFTIRDSDILLHAQWSIIGASTPAGGIVFYDNGSVTGESSWRYLEAAVEEAGTEIPWGGPGIEISGADGTDVGTGWQNTIDIVTQLGEGTYAAKACADYEANGYMNWFLPSKDTPALMHSNLLHRILPSMLTGH